jgi:hypothetical protein
VVPMRVRAKIPNIVIALFMFGSFHTCAYITKKPLERIFEGLNDVINETIYVGHGSQTTISLRI